MSSVTEAIHGHHSELTQKLDEYVKALEEGRSDADPQGLTTFLKGDLLPHATGEEEYMYPAVDPLVKEYGKATATMSVDHEFITGYIRQIEEATQALQGATPENRPALERQLLRASLQLQAILQVHLEKEERVYLPLFARHLAPEEQQRILNGMHEAYEHDMTEAQEPSVKATLDVRQVEPARRHPLIFQSFEALKPGEAFLLVNDHDPKPLYYHFKFEHEGQFTWDYQEEGPETWQVRIGKVR